MSNYRVELIIFIEIGSGGGGYYCCGLGLFGSWYFGGVELGRLMGVRCRMLFVGVGSFGLWWKWNML